jgi:hypothetical protein
MIMPKNFEGTEEQNSAAPKFKSDDSTVVKKVKMNTNKILICDGQTL